MMLEQQWPNLRKEGMNSQLEQLIHFSWEHHKEKEPGFFQSLFHTKASCIAIGAPTHLFLPEVAEALGTKCILPRYAEVANAVGAIVGNVAATHTVEIKPIYTAGGTSGYTVLGQETRSFEEQQEAIEYARQLAVAGAKEEAAPGVTGEIQLECSVSQRESRLGDGSEEMETIFLGSQVVASAKGTIM